nr:MAG TPA: resistance protein [Caudoviricetes sp.]
MSMSIYDIDSAITALIDNETGEVTDEEAFDALQMERDVKVENIGLYFKDLTAEAKAIKEEEASLAARRKAVENKAERLKHLLDYALNGDKFSTPRLKVSYRKSSTVELSAGFTEWAEINADDLLTYSEPKPNKTAIKAAIKDGRVPENLATIETHENISIK